MNHLNRKIAAALWAAAIGGAGSAAAPPPDAIDLSAVQTANCYIVTPGSTSFFDATRKGNSPTATIDAGASARLIWQDTKNLISSLEYDSGVIVAVTASGAEGNAVVAVCDAAGNVLWSWHLWVTDFDPEATAYTTEANSAGTTWTFMDRNMGAMAASGSFPSHGMLYQWGRKDPFPAPADFTLVADDYSYIDGMDGEAELYDIDGNILPKIKDTAAPGGSVELSVANPITFYYVSKTDTGETDEYGMPVIVDNPPSGDWADTSADDRWGGVSGHKSIYDPCPPGWKVPVNDADGNTPYAWMEYSGMTWDATYGGAIDHGQWFPGCGTRYYMSGANDLPRDGNPYSGMWIGTAGTASANLEEYPTLYGQYMMIVNGKRTYKPGKDRRSQGMSLRAVRDEECSSALHAVTAATAVNVRGSRLCFDGDAAIRIISASGATVCEAYANATFDFGFLAPGIYIAAVTGCDGTTASVKFIRR